MLPEENARQQIDAMLIASGWAIQNYKALNLRAGKGIAVCEVPLKSGRCAYLLIFEQMKGRDIRVLSPTDLKVVSGEEAAAKTRYRAFGEPLGPLMDKLNLTLTQ